ncbi:hypothetical protein HMPREF0813_01081 [Streptococcus anginosus F0211]|uniref:Uncharacterized protein n=1 Tax=Streptococcus anginosus F0211 TaxID=706437 RepID=E6J1F6_STRAP|nr:hypothetical protein HMPREF0813_01081 [Streptococcus anginosus F0211]
MIKLSQNFSLFKGHFHFATSKKFNSLFFIFLLTWNAFQIVQ